MTKITKRRFAEAVKGSGGILQQIANKLQVNRSSVYNFIKKHPEYTKKLIFQAEEEIGDFAETALIQKIKEKDGSSIKWYLATKHKNRGYIERQEIEHTGKMSFEITEEEREKAKKRINEILNDGNSRV